MGGTALLEDWNLLADQVLTKGVQKAAETILKKVDTSGDEGNNALPGFQTNQANAIYLLDAARDRQKTKVPAVMEILSNIQSNFFTTEQDITNLNKAALEAYRIKLAKFKTDVSKPVETKLRIA